MCSDAGVWRSCSVLPMCLRLVNRAKFLPQYYRVQARVRTAQQSHTSDRQSPAAAFSEGLASTTGLPPENGPASPPTVHHSADPSNQDQPPLPEGRTDQGVRPHRIRPSHPEGPASAGPGERSRRVRTMDEERRSQTLDDVVPPHRATSSRSCELRHSTRRSRTRRPAVSFVHSHRACPTRAPCRSALRGSPARLSMHRQTARRRRPRYTAPDNVDGCCTETSGRLEFSSPIRQRRDNRTNSRS